MAYAAAVCHRGAECAGATAPSESFPCSASCPDVVFAPGATRTVEGLFACAEDYATWPCEDIRAGRTPPCVTPGTKQVGEPCVFASQCQTLACKIGSQGPCGICARVVAASGDCTAADALCNGDAPCIQGVCLPSNPVIKQPGEPCASFVECDQVDSFCNEQGICELYPGENESCTATNHCTSEFYCASADQVCQRRSGLDAACGNDASTNYPACAAGLVCTAEASPDPGTCVEPITVQAGGDCTSTTARCVTGATCTCTADPCVQKRCTVPRLVGESCDAANLCHPALDCANGLCVPGAYQNRYEDACGL